MESSARSYIFTSDRDLEYDTSWMTISAKITLHGFQSRANQQVSSGQPSSYQHINWIPLFERMIVYRLENNFGVGSTIGSNKLGFPTGHSTVDAPLKSKNLALEEMRKRQFYATVQPRSSKFNTMPWQQIWDFIGERRCIWVPDL